MGRTYIEFSGASTVVEELWRSICTMVVLISVSLVLSCIEIWF